MHDNVPIRPNLVWSAVRSIRAFGGEYLTREQAAVLLDRWGHRYSLTEAEARSALHHFPPADSTATEPVPNGVEGRPIGGRR